MMRVAKNTEFLSSNEQSKKAFLFASLTLILALSSGCKEQGEQSDEPPARLEFRQSAPATQSLSAPEPSAAPANRIVGSDLGNVIIGSSDGDLIEGRGGDDLIMGDPTDEPVQSIVETATDMVIFESGQVRPLAISANGSQLYAVNTPDSRLEIFDLTNEGPVYNTSVTVGLEPVSVAVDPNNRIWVVNHLSDNISIVDPSLLVPAVIRTLNVGDEPRDIVFAGSARDRAFITTAHRGQNAPFDPQLTVDGVGRADVWVFDINDLGAAEGGTPVAITNLFADTPRALAVSPDGNTVYAAAFHSGNQTTTLFADRDNGGLDKPPPTANVQGFTAPETGLIVRFDGTDWKDNGDPTTGVAGKVWNDRVLFNLPDYDVFEIDASAATPTVTVRHSGVGTTLFNMAANPVTGALYVSNTEARNEVRFEGRGAVGTSVRGDMVRTRISIIDGGVTHRNLNKHITSYDQELGTATENSLATSQILEMAVTSDGSDIYAVSFGNGKILRYATSALEDNSFTVAASSQVKLTGGGPTGLVLDEARGRAYVLTRFDNGISTVDMVSLTETAHLQMFNPEPSHVVDGRPFLYDAELSSSRGDHSCASCHIFGDADQLAWDLGEPGGVVKDNPRDYAIGFGAMAEFHPMKGPMTTQSLRGLAGNGPMHWRGDRTGVSADADETLEEQAFEDFNPAFEGLLGRNAQLSEAQMDLFAKFALEISYPPNPIRNLDNSLTAGQADGRNTYLTVGTTGGNRGQLRCTQCHELDETNNRFGTNGLMSVEGDQVAEDFKIPHLRNMYTKVGRFGSTDNAAEQDVHMGDQIRGFGFTHDGAVDTLDTFLGPKAGSAGFFFASAQAKANVIDFVFAMDSELFPIVGQQVTLSADNSDDEAVEARIDLLAARAAITAPREECDLVVTGLIDGEMRGAVMVADGTFDTDKVAESGITLTQLKSVAAASGNVLTFMCVPPGEGRRVGIDRDADEFLNAVEVFFGSNPADPTIFPE